MNGTTQHEKTAWANACKGTRGKALASMTAGDNQGAVAGRISSYASSPERDFLLGELYKVHGRYSDSGFQRRVFEGTAFREVLAACADEHWLRDLRKDLHDLRYKHAILMRNHRRLLKFDRALRKAILAGAGLRSLPTGGPWGELTHALGLCLNSMDKAEEGLKDLLRGLAWKETNPRRKRPSDPGFHEFLWQMENYP
jgi:hypothetical protein